MFITFILGFILLQQFILYITNTKLNVLSCGLFCYVGKEPANPEKLKILGLYNLSRGEHATGVCIDDVVTKDVVNIREFLVKHTEVFNFSDYEIVNNTFLGHCRQATAYYSKEKLAFAHPHETSLDGKDFLRLVHNGTVSNCTDLAKKYNLTIVDKSDSMLVAEIITQKWKDKDMSILKEYEGAATLIFYPVATPNTAFIHRDAQRELFYWKESADSMYISSIKDSLVAIGAKLNEVVEFDIGYLYKIVNAKIIHKWDFTEKVPYEEPRPTYNRNKNTTFYSTPIKSNKSTKVKEGLYWEDHKICNNGHEVTGVVFIGKNGEKPVRNAIDKEERHKYDKYFIVGGVPMKNEVSYKTIFSMSSKDKVFDGGLFKNILASELAKHSLYPVLAKIFTNNKDMFFWFKDLDNLKTLDDVYTWSPILSGITFEIDKIGMLKSSNKIIDVIEDNVAIIQNLIEAKVASGGHYNTPEPLLRKFEEIKSNTKVEFDVFILSLMQYFEKTPFVSYNTLSKLQSEYQMANFKEERHADLIFLGMVTDTLLNVQAAIKSKNEYAISSEIINEINQAELEDSDYYDTPAFRNNALFGDYQTLKELTDNFHVDKNPKNLKALYIGLGRLLLELGKIDVEALDVIKRSSPQDTKRSIEIIYDELKQHQQVEIISEIFANNDITEPFANLCMKVLELENLISLTKEQELELDILKLGIKYVRNKSKNLSKTTLKEVHGLEEEQIEKLCS